MSVLDKVLQYWRMATLIVGLILVSVGLGYLLHPDKEAVIICMLATLGVVAAYERRNQNPMLAGFSIVVIITVVTFALAFR